MTPILVKQGRNEAGSPTHGSETGEARDVAHFALLVGYGAGAIDPYVAFETIEELVEEGTYVPSGIDLGKATNNYLKACDKGLLKTMAKMAISTARCRASRASASTCSRRKWRCVTNAPSPTKASPIRELDPGGLYQWRRRGDLQGVQPVARGPSRELFNVLLAEHVLHHRHRRHAHVDRPGSVPDVVEGADSGDVR